MIRLKQDDTTTTSRLLVECLENEGVRYIFGIPGEENLELMSELKNSKIKLITTRHEQGAAFMADVYGRLTGHAGVCLATLAGATNLATGVADANGDGAPLIAITGQVGTERMHITSHQYMDLTKFFEPITKRAKMVVRPDTINEILRIAFKYAESERPGACHIDLPVNISKMKFPATERPLKREIPLKEKAVQGFDIRGSQTHQGSFEPCDPGRQPGGACPCIQGSDTFCRGSQNTCHQYYDGKGHNPVRQQVRHDDCGHPTV